MYKISEEIMKIKQALPEIQRQILLKRTMEGRGISDYAVDALQAIIDDVGNHDNADAVKCRGCGLIMSSALTMDGCIYCGVEDFDIF